MKKIEKEIREYFGESIWGYLGGEEIKIVKRVPGRVTKVKVLNMPNSDDMKRFSQYIGELVIFNEMNEIEKDGIKLKKYDIYNKFAKTDMADMKIKIRENRRKKRKRKKLRKSHYQIP